MVPTSVRSSLSTTSSAPSGVVSVAVASDFQRTGCSRGAPLAVALARWSNTN